MKEHAFTVYLNRQPSDADIELLGPACNDGTIGSCQGVHTIEFDRESESLETAIRSAIADVTAAGFTIQRVEIDLEAFQVVS